MRHRQLLGPTELLLRTSGRSNQAAQVSKHLSDGPLGSDRLEIRLGGIYALERIAVDSERDHRTVVEVLGAFVREQRSQPAPPNNAETATDVEAAVTVLGRLPDRFDTSRANLASVYLATANLRRANLRRANLREADLLEANLLLADLVGAILQGANLQWAFLHVANLQGADLQRAILRGADLRAADLRGANLQGADLGGVQLQKSKCDAYTVWPGEFDWKAAGVILREDSGSRERGTEH